MRARTTTRALVTMVALSLVLGLSPMPAQATQTGERYSGAEFSARVSGRTLYFERNGFAYGAEQYFPDQRVIWAFENGQCQRGHWFENSTGDICFTYHDDLDPTPICWDFLRTPGGGIAARAKGAHPLNDLIAVHEDTEPLACELPDLGV